MKGIILLSVFSLFFFQGCATVFKGYNSTIKITNYSDSLKVKSCNGLNFELVEKEGRVIVANKFQTQKFYEIELPTNIDHCIKFTGKGKQKTVFLRRKLGIGWFLLDVIFVLPAIYDGITGNWYYYDDVDLSNMQQHLTQSP